MFANVVKCLEFAIVVAQSDDTLALDAHAHVASRFTQFFLVAKELPATVKNLFALDLEEPGIHVAAGIDRVGTGCDLVVPFSDLSEFTPAKQCTGHGDVSLVV
jgi:hypothetical protein